MAEQVLAGKVGVVFGVANKRSIAWAIAKAWAAAGAKLIFNYQGERLKENVEELVGEFGEGTPLYPCDVSSDADITEFFSKVRGETERIDLMLHSVAFAPKEALEGDFVSTTREAFRTAHDISAYSLVALAREAAPMMTNGGSIVAMTYYGAEKVVPHYGCRVRRAGQDALGHDQCRLQRQTKINRKDWGLNWNVALETGGWLVGDRSRSASSWSWSSRSSSR